MDTPLDKNYAEDYTDDSYWAKIKDYAKAAGREIVEKTFCLYYAAQDADTPTWARGVIVGAIGYFICPLDAIPDMVPVVGYADDLGVIVSALGIVAAHVKPEHHKKASDTAGEWFD